MAKPPTNPEEDDVDLDGAGARSGPPLRLILIAAAAALVLLGGGGAGAFLLFFNKPAAESGSKAEKKKSEGRGEKGEGAETAPQVVITQGPDGVVYCSLPNMVVNMQGNDGRPVYLKLKISLEAQDEAAADLIDPSLPRIQDMLQSFLRELRPEDLQGSQGTYQLRMEILRRVNLAIAPARVKAVLIEEMLIS